MLSPLHPQFRIGILGGGQLGRMLLPPAMRFNLNLAVLDPDPAAPCADFTPDFHCGELTEYDAVIAFGRDCDLITIEIENVSTEALFALRNGDFSGPDNHPRLVRPSPEIIQMIQDKLTQKEFLIREGLSTAEFVAVETQADLPRHFQMFPAVQKLRRSGYDGRGVQVLDSPDDDRAFDAPSILERKIDFEKEITLIVSRNPSGQIVTFPVVEMEFHPEANLVEYLFSPANLSDALVRKAQEMAAHIAETLQLEGLLAIEMFVHGTDILINEMAPRPHNSGHHTIEACLCSQYEQLWRAVLDLPPGDTTLQSPAVMVNLLGAPGQTGPTCYDSPELQNLLSNPGVHLHLYGKKITRPYRKMGHITILHAQLERARQLARSIRRNISINAYSEESE